MKQNYENALIYWLKSAPNHHGNMIKVARTTWAQPVGKWKRTRSAFTLFLEGLVHSPSPHKRKYLIQIFQFAMLWCIFVKLFAKTEGCRLIKHKTVWKHVFPKSCSAKVARRFFVVFCRKMSIQTSFLKPFFGKTLFGNCAFANYWWT